MPALREETTCEPLKPLHELTLGKPGIRVIEQLEAFCEFQAMVTAVPGVIERLLDEPFAVKETVGAGGGGDTGRMMRNEALVIALSVNPALNALARTNVVVLMDNGVVYFVDVTVGVFPLSVK